MFAMGNIYMHEHLNEKIKNSEEFCVFHNDIDISFILF